MKLFVFLLLINSIIFPSELEEEKIIWSEDYKLTWADFKAPHRKGVSYVASTSSGISFSYSYSDKSGENDLKVVIHSNFYPKRSWVNPNEASDYILAHEQAHFDISEIHARKLRKEIAGNTFSKNMNEELTAIYNDVDEERVAMQHLFDKETDHSKIKEKELEWEAYIKQQLKEYDRWK